MDELQQILTDCGVATKVMAYFIVGITGALGFTIRLLWKKIGDVEDAKQEIQQAKDLNDKEYLTTLKDVTHVLDNVSKTVIGLAPEVKREIQETERRLSEIIRDRNERKKDV
jgi:hypothetical protein